MASFETLETNEDYDRVVKTTTTKPLLVQFSAPWCRRCTTLKTEIADAFDDKQFRWVVVDVDACEALRERFEVVSLPRLDFYAVNSSTRHTLVGFESTIEKLKAAIVFANQTRVLETDHDF